MYELVFEAMNQPLCVTRRDGSILTANHAFKQIIFFDANVLDKPLSDYITFLDKLSLLDVLNINTNNNVSEPKFVKINRGGIVKYFKLWISFMDADRVVALFTPYDDLPIEQIEQPFLRSHKHCADMLEKAPIPIHSVDEHLQIIYSNEIERNLLGFGKENILGTSLLDLASNQETKSKFASSLNKHISSTINNTLGVESSISIKGPNGVVHDFTSNVNVLRTNGQYHYSRVFLRDDKERRLMNKIERLKYEAAVVQKMNVARDRIIRDILHELKTPAHVFLSMGNSIDDNDIHDIQLIKDTLGGAMKDILLMTDDFHTLIDRQSDQCSIEQFLNEVISLARLSIPAGQEIMISQCIAKDYQSIDIANHQYFQRAIFHILRQAILYNRDCQEIIIEVSRAEMSPGAVEYLNFTVVNISKAPSKQAELLLFPKSKDSLPSSSITTPCLSRTASGSGEDFNINMTYDNSDTEGFGLNISQRVADLISGKLSCNILGDVVRLTFSMPMSKLAQLNRQYASRYIRITSPCSKNFRKVHFDFESVQEQTIPSDKLPPERHSFRILIVDDTVSVQKVMARNLEKLGHFCVCADNGEDALNKIESCVEGEMFDVILMDLRMPVMDGITATSRIRSHSNVRIRETPVAIISADCTSVVKEAAKKVGADVFFEKPISISTLSHYLDELVVEEVNSEFLLNDDPFEF